MKLTVMKEIGTKWLVSMNAYSYGPPKTCRSGFVRAGIQGAIANPDNNSLVTAREESADPFSDLDYRYNTSVCTLLLIEYGL